MYEYEIFSWERAAFSETSLGVGADCLCLGTQANAILITMTDAGFNKLALVDGATLGGHPLPAGAQIVADQVLRTVEAGTNTPEHEIVFGRVIVDTAARTTDIRVVFSTSALAAGAQYKVCQKTNLDDRAPGQNSFARGTLIDTPHGAIPVEHLEEGDEVLTRDGGVQLIAWQGHHRLSALELVLRPQFRPIRIMAGALTGGRPGQDLFVSQSHRLMVDDWRAPYLFGEEEILIPAKSLLNNKNVVVECPLSGVEYFQLLTDADTMVCANGLWSETLVPTGAGLDALPEEDRRQVQEIIANRRPVVSAALPALPFDSAASIAA
jgi:hypothetical protein